MFREMSRKFEEISFDECQEILDKGVYGNLATISNNGYPYVTPVNYVFFDNFIYFHTATNGQKLDNIYLNSRVCFSIVIDVAVLPEKFTTRYRSVIVFGEVAEIFDREKENALLNHIRKYSGNIEEGSNFLNNLESKAKVFKIHITHMTGKKHQ